MKPVWQESWEAFPWANREGSVRWTLKFKDGQAATVLPESFAIETAMNESRELIGARAKLASAAPEMASLLLELRANAANHTSPEIADPITVAIIDRVLRKAGVIE